MTLLDDILSGFDARRTDVMSPLQSLHLPQIAISRLQPAKMP